MDWTRATHIGEGNLLSAVYLLMLISYTDALQTHQNPLTKYLGTQWPDQVETKLPITSLVWINEESVRLQLEFRAWNWKHTELKVDISRY